MLMVYFLFLQPLVFVVMTDVQCWAHDHKWVQQPKMNDCLTLEGTMIFQNIRNHTPNNTVSHSSRPEFTATPLWDHKILHCRKDVGHPKQLVLLVTRCGKDKIHNIRCQALTRVQLKMQVFWDTKLCHWMIGYWLIGRCCCLGIHHEVVQEQWHLPRDTYLQSV